MAPAAICPCATTTLGLPVYVGTGDTTVWEAVRTGADTATDEPTWIGGPMATGGPTATGGPVVTEAPVTGGPRTGGPRATADPSTGGPTVMGAEMARLYVCGDVTVGIALGIAGTDPVT
mmetsp:Transcript_25672/g.61207  ORF Transcript_25672/g.61207 Transcript_25672/m.61207 type:complete len:119 (-) Transcript_25672:419-775(-)